MLEKLAECATAFDRRSCRFDKRRGGEGSLAAPM
jgi:hypothetical protein